MSCASAYRAMGIGMAWPAVSVAALYLAGMKIVARPSPGLVVSWTIAERGSSSPFSVARARAVVSTVTLPDVETALYT